MPTYIFLFDGVPDKSVPSLFFHICGHLSPLQHCVSVPLQLRPPAHEPKTQIIIDVIPDFMLVIKYVNVTCVYSTKPFALCSFIT